MPLVKWFLWRRWQLKRWVRDLGDEQPLIDNLYKANLAYCRTYPVIYQDMCKIIRRACEANVSASQRSDQK